MAIDPNNIDITTIPDLPAGTLALADLLVKSNTGGTATKITTQQLATFLAPYVASVGASGYVPVNSLTLPNPTSLSSAFSLVGPGTYTQTTGGNVVTTFPLTIISWNGTTWTLTQNIPIDLSSYVSKTDFSISFKPQGLKFNNAIVNVAPAVSFYGNPNAFTVEILIKPNDTVTTQMLLDNGTGMPSIYIDADKLVVSKSGVSVQGTVNIGGRANTTMFIVIAYNGVNHSVRINDVDQTFTVSTVSTYTPGLNTLTIGKLSAGNFPYTGELYLLRIYVETLSGADITTHYNLGYPNLYVVPKINNLVLELIGDNATTGLWGDSSIYKLKGVVSGSATKISNAVESSASQATYLSVIPSLITVAVGREFNLWYASFIQSYGKDVRVSCNCAVGKSSERAFRYTPTTGESNSLRITVKDLNNVTLESKTVTLQAISKPTSSTVLQILEIGDSTRDSLNPVDYPVVPSGRTRYEYMHELYDLIIAEGKFVPLFLGNRGVSPYKHEAYSGYSTEGFSTNNVLYPNPFWDGTRNNLKAYMSENSNFGGANRIDIISIQLGINDLKSESITVADTLIRYKSIVDSYLDATYGYPSAKILISYSPYSGDDRTGWVTAFNAVSDWDLFCKRMVELADGLKTAFASYGNVFIVPTMFWVDRKFGYPNALIAASARSSQTEFQFTDSVHPGTSGYYQAADAEYSNILRTF